MSMLLRSCVRADHCAVVGPQYINFVADRLLVALGQEKHYHTPNPFDWMEMLSLQCVLASFTQ